MSSAKKEALIRDFRDFVAEKLDEIANALKGEPLITLIVRFEGPPGRDILMTMDKLEEIEALITRLKTPEPGAVDIPADEPRMS